ncbi:MAG: hypothetical protein R3F43_30000 [bacterium]
MLLVDCSPSVAYGLPRETAKGSWSANAGGNVPGGQGTMAADESACHARKAVVAQE